MLWPRWLPWPRRRRPHPQVEQATARITQAANDKAEADQVLGEAREISEWARKASIENRFDLRLEAAWRAKTTGER